MAGSCSRGPAGGSNQTENLNDGTLIRGLSPQPGPIVIDPCSMQKGAATAGGSSSVDQLLKQLHSVSNGPELQRISVAILGPQCFSAGIIAGVGVEIFTSAKELIKLISIFVLADLQDLRTGQLSWWQYANLQTASRLLQAKLAGLFFEKELSEAAAERDAIIKELSDAFQNPTAWLEGLADGIAESYKKDWQEFKAHSNAGTLEGQFRAGMIFGQLLFDILGLITGAAGLAKGGAKLAAKLPRLAKYARSVQLKPGAQRLHRRSAGGGIGGTLETPPKPVPEAMAPPPRSSHPPGQLAKPTVPKTVVTKKSHIEAQLDDMYAKAPGAKVEIDALAERIAQETGGKVAKAPLKGRTRAMEKAIEYEKRGGDASNVKDIARNTIVVEQSQYDKAVALLKEQGAKVKKIDPASDPMGYSGTNAVVKTKAGIPAEIQVNTPEMIYAKEKPEIAREILGEQKYTELATKSGVPAGRGHQLYEQYRSLPEGDPRAVDLATESRAYFDYIRRTGGQ